MAWAPRYEWDHEFVAIAERIDALRAERDRLEARARELESSERRMVAAQVLAGMFASGHSPSREAPVEAIIAAERLLAALDAKP